MNATFDLFRNIPKVPDGVPWLVLWLKLSQEHMDQKWPWCFQHRAQRGGQGLQSYRKLSTVKRCAEGHKGREELRGLCEVQGVTLQPLAGSRTHQRCSQAAEHTQPSRLPGGHPVPSLSLLRAVLGGSK